MKQVAGIWLPDTDNHFARMMGKEPFRDYFGKQVGVYQYFKIERALDLVGNHGIALDIGAHVGFWSMWLAQSFEHVHAFEPVHGDCFAHNVNRDNVTLHRVAVGRQSGFTGITLDGANSGKTSLARGASIEVRSIDSYSFENVGLMKIDVEGYEPEVLEGAAETIKRCKPLVVFEDNGQHERYEFEDPHAVAKRLGLKEVCQMGADWIYQA